MSDTKKLDIDVDIPDDLEEYKDPDVSIDAIRPKWWKLRKPDFASIDVWHEWKENAKKAFPFRYWIQEDLSLWFSIKLKRIEDAWWWIRYRTTDRNHVIKLKLDGPGYYDARTLILYSAFEIFDKFMQFQHSDECHTAWDSEYHAAEWKEMNEIWEWWKQRETREERFEQEHPYPELPDEWGFMAPFRNKYREEPIVKQWGEVADLHNKQEVAWDKEDEEMLIRLSKIRLHLWN